MILSNYVAFLDSFSCFDNENRFRISDRRWFIAISTYSRDSVQPTNFCSFSSSINTCVCHSRLWSRHCSEAEVELLVDRDQQLLRISEEEAVIRNVKFM